jgi:hypothetical protein
MPAGFGSNKPAMGQVSLMSRPCVRFSPICLSTNTVIPNRSEESQRRWRKVLAREWLKARPSRACPYTTLPFRAYTALPFQGRPFVSFRAKSRNLGPLGYRKGEDLLSFGVHGWGDWGKCSLSGIRHRRCDSSTSARNDSLRARANGEGLRPGWLLGAKLSSFAGRSNRLDKPGASWHNRLPFEAITPV